MNISLNWLKEYVAIPKKYTPADIAKILTMQTVEVEGIIDQAEKYKNVVIGKILKIEKHPNADRLQIAQVDIKSAKLQIVCGASNIAVGQLVPVALVGAVLPNNMEIKEAEVRGVKSFGMMCAPDELGLGDDHSGILILDDKAKVGRPFSDYQKINDIVFEVDNKSLTNRPDLWSHYGLARELSAVLGAKFSPYIPKEEILKDQKANLDLKVKVEDSLLCPRYMAVAVANIKIESSPAFIQEKLLAANIRPINNIVDITNYVMMGLGQPLHAFDQAMVDEIVVRRAKKGEKIETLDGNNRELTIDDLVIADSSRAIAIAGVMGGANSEINSNTTTIIIESANFNPSAVRKTSTKFGLRSESSMRFEKSLDPNLCLLGLCQAVELIKTVCPQAIVASPLIDISDFKLDQGPIEFDPDYIEKFIGEKIKSHDIKKILESLGFTIEKNKDKWLITIPTWRATKDIRAKEDLAEEVVRIYGYDKINSNLPKVQIKSTGLSEEIKLERRIKDLLSLGLGLAEAYNYSFVGDEQLKKLSIDAKNYIKLANPIASNLNLMRQSLSPNLFLNVRTNQARYEKIKIFEIGNIYLNNPGVINKDNASEEKLPFQEKRIGILLAGARNEELYNEIKGMAGYLGQALGLELQFLPTEIKPSWADEKFATLIKAGDKSIGAIMKLDISLAKGQGIKKEVFTIEFSFNELVQAYYKLPAKRLKEIEKFPPLVRDIAFVVDAKIMYNNIKDEIAGFDELIKQVELFDVYEGGKLGDNKKNLAFHVVYQTDRTLTSGEVDAIQSKLISHLEKKFDAKIRNF